MFVFTLAATAVSVLKHAFPIRFLTKIKKSLTTDTASEICSACLHDECYHKEPESVSRFFASVSFFAILSLKLAIISETVDVAAVFVWVSFRK